MTQNLNFLKRLVRPDFKPLLAKRSIRTLTSGLCFAMAPLLMLVGCCSTKPQQLLCQLSKDSIPTFQFAQLVESAQLASDAYRDSSAILNAYGSKYLVEIIPLPNSSGQAIFLKDTVTHRQIIGIRGTETKYVKSVLTDAKYTKDLNPKLGIYVHAGFQKAANELYDSLASRLDSSYTTSITGHSLGGALAVLITYYMTVDGYKLERTVTFGQPKVTNRDGVEKFKSVDLLRVINAEDPVAFVPPISFVSAKNAPYQHAGGALVLQDSPPFEYVRSEASNITFVTEFWDDILGQEKDAKSAFLENLTLHRDKFYLQKLAALADSAKSAPK
jgi:triacylglycerol lipase